MACSKNTKKPHFLLFPRESGAIETMAVNQHFHHSGVMMLMPQPPQSLDSTELQLGEVLDGANHLAGVAVLIQRAFGPLLKPSNPVKSRLSAIAHSLVKGCSPATDYAPKSPWLFSFTCSLAYLRLIFKTSGNYVSRRVLIIDTCRQPFSAYLSSCEQQAWGT